MLFSISEQSGSLHFDSRTRTVMAGQDSHDNIKEKVKYMY